MTATHSAEAQGRYAPLVICPPLVAGESLTSWVARIAHRNKMPLALMLQRLTLAATDRHHDMPKNYGLSLTDAQRNAVAAMTGTPPEAVAGSLIETYHDGPVNLSGYYAEPQRGLAVAARSEWIHLTRSFYCPDCLRETGGVWQLAWRLPWSFACSEHGILLASLCPGCDQPARRGRGDRTLTPGFIDNVPQPMHCHNSVTAYDSGYDTRPGRGAKPCGYDFADTPTTHIGDLTTVTEAQDALLPLLADGGHRDAWKDLRALVATLMYFADSHTLTTLAPTVAEPLLRIPALADAIAAVEDDRQARVHIQQRLRDGGRDHRTGTRQRYSTTTPTDPALMAVLTPIALHFYEPHAQGDDERVQGLADLASLARKQRNELPRMLATAGASDRLIADAEKALRATGRFSDAVTTTHHGLVDPSAIPAYLWAEEAAPFLAVLPKTREDTTRMFASMTVLKHLTGDTWADVTTRLGLPATKARIVPALVNRLTQAGTQAAFHAAAQTVIDRLASGDIRTVDYADRRHRLRNLKRIPTDVLHAADPTLTATTARRTNAAAWLWAHLTGGHPWEAPAWNTNGPTESRKERYRRFVKRDLERLRPALLAHGDGLLH